MKKKKMNKKQKKLMNIAIVSIIGILLIVSILVATGFFGLFTTWETFIDTRDGGNAAKWIMCGSGSGEMMFAQKIVIPSGVVYLDRCGFTGIVRYQYGCDCYAKCGLSNTLSTNPNNWLTVQQVSVSDSQTYGTAFDIDYSVSAGETYYLMFKPISSGNCGCMYYYPTYSSEYPDGDIYVSEQGGAFQQQNYDAHFYLQGEIDYGISFDVPSAGAYPSTISVGGSTTIQWSVHSSTGGTCSIVVYGGSSKWHEETQTFSKGETKTGSFQKSGISGNPGGSLNCRVQVEVGGQEEAHKTFYIYFSEEEEHPPSTPIVSGDNTLQIGQTGSWSAVSYDQDGDNIRYYWKVDNNVERLSGFKSSGLSDSFSWSFSSAGVHQLSVKAEDDMAYSSSWETRTITVSSTTPNKYTVTIYIKDSMTNNAISEATVVCSGETKTTNSQGVVTYSLSPGSYTAYASKADYLSNSVSFSVVSSAVSKTILLTPSGGTLEYPVTIEVYDDTTNLAIEDATVTIGSESKLTNEYGTVIFDLEGGELTYQVSVAKTGYNSDTKDITVYDSSKSVVFYLLSTTGHAPATPGFEFGIMFLAIIFVMAFIISKRNYVKKEE